MNTTNSHHHVDSTIGGDGSHLVSLHHTSEGVTAYVRRPDGRLRVVQLDVDLAGGTPRRS